MNKVILGDASRKKVLDGLNISADAVKSTFGYRGRNVLVIKSLLDQNNQPVVRHAFTKDGVSVAESINLWDNEEKIGANLIKSASKRTVMDAGDGPQPLYSKVLTPKGFVNMGDIKKGDEVCGTNGTIQKVLGVYPKGEKEICRITFFDNRVVECCVDHLWTVIDNCGKKSTMTVKELIKGGKVLVYKKHDRKQYGYYTPQTFAEFAEDKSKMPIDPYLLGLLLGDGSLSGSGSIELSLGKKKEHVIKKIVLPEGMHLSVRFVESKNSFRVKITGGNPKHPTAHKLIESLGLLGVRSSTKFIPKEYLYSSSESRKKLLQGLLDTDGYINKKGLFEFSTISEQLSNDMLELARGLGRSAGKWKLTRTEGSSYSMTPIYRIQERRGYMYGVKLKSIVPTGVFTEMQCIKVSNPDNLYITDDYIVTHNTTLTSILTQSLINKGEELISKGGRPIDIKKGMQLALDKTFELIETYVVRPKGDVSLLKSIAKTASNDDDEITNAIVEVIRLVGASASVDFRMVADKTAVDVAEGTIVNIGYINEYFVTNTQMKTAELTETLVLVYDGNITALNQLAPFLEKVLAKNPKTNLLIFCAKMDGEALKTTILNKVKGGLNVCVCSSPDWESGIERLRIMEDICVITGAKVISEAKGNELRNVDLRNLGRAEKIIVSNVGTTIIGGGGDPTEVVNHITSLAQSLEINKEMTEYEKHYTQKRIQNMNGKVARISIGGATEDERLEKKDRVEDAICAIRSADEQGVVAGGGSIFLRISDVLEIKNNNDDIASGFYAVKDTLFAPFEQLLANAGIKNEKGLLGGRSISESVLQSEKNCGYNLKTEKVENLFDAGVLDSAKVLKCSLVNAISVTNLYLSTNVSIVNCPKP